MNLPENNPNSIWHFLFTNQRTLLADKAHSSYLKALDEMHEVIHPDRVPDFEAINRWFETRTGWEVVKVPGLIDDDAFFKLLAQKKFPSSEWLRDLDHLSYLEEPDMFHDIFGHIPLLANASYSALMHSFGLIAKEMDFEATVLEGLQKMYWFTIEFGLMLDADGLPKIFGAGILSSPKESVWSLLDPTPGRLPLKLEEVLDTEVVTDQIQNLFYIANDFEQVKNMLQAYECKQKNYLASRRTVVGGYHPIY